MGNECEQTTHREQRLNRIITNQIPLDQYVCTKCKKVPELRNFHSDNGLIQFKCKEHDNLTLTVPEYFQFLNKSEYNYYNATCSNCNIIQKDEIRRGIFKYCYVCRKIFCPNCCKNEEYHPKFHHGKTCDINELNSRCDNHFEDGDYTDFCLDCKENICKKYFETKHLEHNIISFSSINRDQIKESMELIRKKNQLLNDIMQFNTLILTAYEKYPTNYMHITNLISLGNLIRLENERDPRDLENAFIELKNNIKNNENALQKFNEKYKMTVQKQQEKLILRYKELFDIDLEKIAQLKLVNLKELDLSHNKIKTIDYLRNMYLSFVQYLSLNNNHIKDVNPLKNINFKELIELNLQNNDIDDVKPLADTEMPVIEILRIEGNKNINVALDNFKQVIKKYDKKLIYQCISFEDFNEKYGMKEVINQKSIKFELNGNENGDDALRDLVHLIPENNNLKDFTMTNCRIETIRLLSRIHLPKVEIINLSYNNIIDIAPLSCLRTKNLKSIYLHENYISDISPLLKTKFNCEKPTIDVHKNNLVLNDETYKIIKEMKEKNIDVIIDYRQVEKNFEENTEFNKV